MTIVSTAELAAEAGISPQVACEHARRGIFVRVSPGRFDREASMANYLAHLRAASVGKRGPGAAFASTGDTPNERSRLATAQEMKNQIAAGKLVDASAVESEWAAIVVACRDAILATPARVAAELPHMTAFDISVVDRHLREALTRLGSDGAP
jgi:phage terminase Nu1 subunit (DNA packaging protein)